MKTKKKTRKILAAAFVYALAATAAHAQTAETPYKFERGYPAADSVKRAFDASDLRRAIEAYKFFYPTMSTEALIQELPTAGGVPNEVSLVLALGPRMVVPTGNSDTPYTMTVLDLQAAGPMVVEIPAGPFIGLMSDHNCRWVMDMGTNGPDKGQGGKHLVLPPDYKGEVPEGYYVGRSKTWKTFVVIRSMPADGDAAKAIKAVDAIKIYPLAKAGQPVTHHFIDVSGKSASSPLLKWEGSFEYWRQLHAVMTPRRLPTVFAPCSACWRSWASRRASPSTPTPA
jgi:hypothetical protein